MCKGLLGKKLGMAGVFSPEGTYIPVTVVQAGPCVVTQIKSEATDGYNALQLGFEEKKASRTNKPLKGHFQKSGSTCFAFLREFPVENPEEYTLGQEITVDLFAIGELIDATGVVKGRGFSGVMKRHGFSGGRKTHGSKSHRIPGSVGCSAWPSKVFKGKKLPGRYGNFKKMSHNLEIVDIRPDKNIIMVKGALPGSRSGLISLYKNRKNRC